MARKIRFPLKMQNGADVRTIEELRENFDIESVLGYYANGKLATWLSDRYYDAEAEQVKSLDPNSRDLNKQICNIIGVECVEESTETDLEAIKLRNERIATLRQVTDDEEIIKNVDSVAFDQDELFDLLDDNTNVIYLFGEKFSVPLGKRNVKYIGVNKPEVLINSQTPVNWEEKKISFENVRFDEKYKKISEVAEGPKKKEDGNVSTGSYSKNSYLNFRLSNNDIKSSEKLFDKIASQIKSINYDINADTENLRKIIRSSGLCEAAQKYIERI